MILLIILLLIIFFLSFANPIKNILKNILKNKQLYFAIYRGNNKFIEHYIDIHSIYNKIYPYKNTIKNILFDFKISYNHPVISITPVISATNNSFIFQLPNFNIDIYKLSQGYYIDLFEDFKLYLKLENKPTQLAE